MPDRKTAPAKKAASAAAARKAMAGAKPPAKKKPGKSIVNQKQTPWGLIATTTAIVVFAAAIVVYVVVNKKSNNSSANGGCTKMIGSNATSFLNELQCAADIQGVTFHPEPNRNHVNGVIKYDVTPPVGGNHSPVWADCAGHVYSAAIANENAVHMLEHGAIWITYKPGLSAAELTTLSALVNGKDRMAMSPYPGLDSPISLQAWGYQLKVDSASDSRIAAFIKALRHNPKTTPENQPGVVCSDSYFLQHLANSTPGHPIDS
jgi:hypothetical protein